MHLHNNEDQVAFQEHLKMLHKMSLELWQAATLDDIYRRAIEYGHHELGFDRLGLFIVNPADSTWTGTFGIDPDGNLRDEHDHNEGFSVLVKLMWHDLIAKRDQVIMRDEVVLYDSGNQVGIGWHATAALWKDNNIFGLLFVDNAHTECPKRDYESELISMFSTTLAHLISRKSVEDELRATQKQYRDLFENVPVVVLVEDYSAVKAFIDQLKAEGVTDFRDYFTRHRDAVSHCSSRIKIIDANQAALDLYGVSAKHKLSAVLSQLLTDEASIDLLRDQFIILAEGSSNYRDLFVFQQVSGESVCLDVSLQIAPEAEQTWSRVFVVIQDVMPTDS